jgi:hypothetical protein
MYHFRMIALVVLLASFPICSALGQEVFLNEIHYENSGVDQGEGIELVGPTGLALDGWSVALYDGSSGGVYDTIQLGGQIPSTCGQYGVIFVAYQGLLSQEDNGAFNGLAIVDAVGSIVQFISYPYQLGAVDGPAAGSWSRPLGVSETQATPSGYSLSLRGMGDDSRHFRWRSGPSTFGSCNDRQFLTQGEGQVLGSAAIPKNGLRTTGFAQQCAIYAHPWDLLYDGERNDLYAQTPIYQDINKDGYCDLFVAYMTNERARYPAKLFFYDPTNGTFVDQSDRLENNKGTLFARWLSSADLNADGVADFIVSQHPEKQVSDYSSVEVWLSNGGLSWHQITVAEASRNPVSGEVAGYYHGHAVGDVDHNSSTDIVVANGSNTGSFLLKNDGLGQFEKTALFTQQCVDDASCPASVMIAELEDINKDGLLDLLGQAAPSGLPYLYYGTPEGLFGIAGTRPLVDPGWEPRFQQFSQAGLGDWHTIEIAVFDADSDEDMDIVIEMTNYPAWEFVVLKNNGTLQDGTIQWEDISESFNSYHVSQGLYEDGVPDDNGNMSFSGNWFSTIGAFDINSDGRMDILPHDTFGSYPEINFWTTDWVLLGTNEPFRYEYVRTKDIATTDALIRVDTEQGGTVFLVSLSRPDVTLVNGTRVQNSDWLSDNLEGVLHLCSSATVWGDISLPGVTCHQVDAASLVSNGSYFGFASSLGPDQGYVRLLPENRSGIPSILSGIATSSPSSNWQPDIEINSSAISGQAPFQIILDDTGAGDPNGDPVTYRWDLGDGTSKEGRSISHTFSAAGQYDVVLQASDGLFETSDTLRISVASGVSSETMELPESYELRAAYPNPFNPTTTIAYALPAPSEVRISVVDMLGRRVTTLVAGETMPAGYHSVQFDAGKLSSGTYLVTMEAGNFVATRKLILLK